MDLWNGFRVVASVEDDITTDSAKGETLADQLNVLLADISVMYHTVHEFHWNVKGKDFYQYHKFYDEIVSDLQGSIDPIAENIRKLGDYPKYTMSEILKLTTLKEVDKDKSDPTSLTSELISLNSSVINTLKKTFTIANDNNEQGIANFIAERIDMHQKWEWFLQSSAEE